MRVYLFFSYHTLHLSLRKKRGQLIARCQRVGVSHSLTLVQRDAETHGQYAVWSRQLYALFSQS